MWKFYFSFESLGLCTKTILLPLIVKLAERCKTSTHVELLRLQRLLFFLQNWFTARRNVVTNASLWSLSVMLSSYKKNRSMRCVVKRNDENDSWQMKIWFDLWCLTPLSTIFQLHRGCGQFYWWRKPEYLDLPQVLDKFYHIILCTLSGIRTRSVVIGTDCIGSCKFNNHTIMTLLGLVPLVTRCTRYNITWYILSVI